MQFLENAPRFLFFTGKGGVGKTSIACATALELTARGKRVLLVSTDPPAGGSPGLQRSYYRACTRCTGRQCR